MHIVETPAYRKAFNLYLRKGFSIEQSLKMMTHEHLHYKMTGSGTHYIWRTRDDGKVRSSHAANNGRIFSWDSPPETGHPPSLKLWRDKSR